MSTTPEEGEPVLIPAQPGVMIGNRRVVKVVHYDGKWVPMIWISPYTIHTNIVENGPLIPCRKFVGLCDKGSPTYPLPQLVILTIPEEDLAKAPETVIES
jgi:hypothetical protein